MIEYAKAGLELVPAAVRETVQGVTDLHSRRAPAERVWIAQGLVKHYRVLSGTRTFAEFDYPGLAKDFLDLLVLGNDGIDYLAPPSGDDSASRVTAG